MQFFDNAPLTNEDTLNYCGTLISKSDAKRFVHILDNLKTKSQYVTDIYEGKSKKYTTLQ